MKISQHAPGLCGEHVAVNHSAAFNSWRKKYRVLPFSTRCSGLSQVTAVAAVEGMPSEASVAEGGGAPSRETEAMPEAREVVQDEKSDVEAETEEKEALSSDAQAVDREAFPSTFDELCRQMAERAKFLLEVIFYTPNLEAIVPHCRAVTLGTPRCSMPV